MGLDGPRGEVGFDLGRARGGISRRESGHGSAGAGALEGDVRHGSDRCTEGARHGGTGAQDAKANAAKRRQCARCSTPGGFEVLDRLCGCDAR